eukprot:gene8023-biopygen6097
MWCTAKNAPQVVTSCVACFVADHKMPQDATSCSVCRAAMVTSCHKMSQVVQTLFSDGNTTAYWSQHMSQVVKTLFTSCNKLWWPHKLSQVVEPFFYVLCADNMVAQTQDVTSCLALRTPTPSRTSSCFEGSVADLSKNERVGGGGGMEFPVWRKEFPPARAGVLAPNVDSRVKVRPGSAQTTLAWLICTDSPISSQPPPPLHTHGCVSRSQPCEHVWGRGVCAVHLSLCAPLCISPSVPCGRGRDRACRCSCGCGCGCGCTACSEKDFPNGSFICAG